MNFGGSKLTSLLLSLGDLTDPATTSNGVAPAARDLLGAAWVHNYAKSRDTNGAFNGFSTWRGNVDGVNIATSGVFGAGLGTDTAAMVGAAALLYGARSSNLNLVDRLQSESDNADALGTSNIGHLAAVAHNIIFNGTSWDRMRSASGAVQAGANALGVAAQVRLGKWSAFSAPAAATQATATRAAGAAGVRHVAAFIRAKFTIPPTVNQPRIQLNLRDGASGAGTIIWQENFGVGVAVVDALEQTINIPVDLIGTAATAMTLEFSAAGAATTLQSLSLFGYDTQ